MEPQRLSDLLSPESVLVPLAADGPSGAVRALVESLPLEADGRPELAAAVLERERAGSTGIGNGVAIPHARSSRLAAPRLAVGLAARPLDFKAADGKPVNLVFLLAVPDSAPKSHLKTLAALSRLAMDQKLLRQLQKSSTPAELFSLLAPRTLA